MCVLSVRTNDLPGLDQWRCSPARHGALRQPSVAGQGKGACLEGVPATVRMSGLRGRGGICFITSDEITRLAKTKSIFSSIYFLEMCS